MSRVPVRVIRAAECRRMPWKNGGGETIEIAVHPEGAGLEDFDWRLSAARVATDGPFSTFPGVDRTLAILEGVGLELRVGEDAPVLLRRETLPYAFPADEPTEAQLLEGPITDLNVMTRRGRIVHTVQRLDVEGRLQLALNGEVALIFCAVGTLQIEAGPTLGARDCALIQPACDGLSIAADQGTIVYLIEIRSTTS
ncbi:HutD/Ves family protein [Lichenifustis flavocetrariae]|uniref:HutD family protein n=1 Tax=Lichenifustis flavocetrariae TaxID=2949735 RepID=A0AA42CL90_9HYPH|nr:HutD family protein [Lichenifustis flavocetrariae]MCW6510141.1 HutD family protein [Lichenifustis flavocetrariae]